MVRACAKEATNAPMRRVESIRFDGKRSHGKPKENMGGEN